MTALEIRNLTVAFGPDTAVINDLDLTIEDGCCLALVGGSGSGKTTVGRAVLGLLPPEARVLGSIRLDGEEITGLKARDRRKLCGRRIGYVPQDPPTACNPLRCVDHHVAEAWAAHGLRASRQDIVERLAALDIQDPRSKILNRPHQWSGGMLQRATLAAATAHDPTLAIADEPTSALDHDLAESVLSIMRASFRALLLISHDIELVARHCDRLAVCADGRVVECGEIAKVFRSPSHPATRKLLDAAEARYTEAAP